MAAQSPQSRHLPGFILYKTFIRRVRTCSEQPGANPEACFLNLPEQAHAKNPPELFRQTKTFPLLLCFRISLNKQKICSNYPYI